MASVMTYLHRISYIQCRSHRRGQFTASIGVGKNRSEGNVQIRRHGEIFILRNIFSVRHRKKPSYTKTTFKEFSRRLACALRTGLLQTAARNIIVASENKKRIALDFQERRIPFQTAGINTCLFCHFSISH